jgi:hypothetical protein
MLALLLLAAALGFAFDVALVLAHRWEQVHGRGDGLGMFLPFMGALVFAPAQLGAAIVLWLSFQRRRERAAALTEITAQPSAALGSFQPLPQPMAATNHHAQLDVDDQIFEREKARTTRRTALWLLGSAPIVTVLAELSRLIGMDFTLLELAVALCWVVGFVYASVSIGRYGDWIPLAFALVYPLTGIVIGARF